MIFANVEITEQPFCLIHGELSYACCVGDNRIIDEKTELRVRRAGSGVELEISITKTIKRGSKGRSRQLKSRIILDPQQAQSLVAALLSPVESSVRR
jgi:hypothetical protein